MTTYAKKTCWLIGAIFFFILGVIGIILPVIPQIPFLIIAFFCLSKRRAESSSLDSDPEFLSEIRFKV